MFILSFFCFIDKQILESRLEPLKNYLGKNTPLPDMLEVKRRNKKKQANKTNN
jgi:hypothetical protein